MESRSISPVYVGRAQELKSLHAALGRAEAGEPQVLVVGGEAGVGKTRLLEEFLTGAQGAGRDAVTAVGGCLELGADGLPFAPFATALRALHRQLGDELDAAVEGREAELARLLPELGTASRERHDQEGRARLFELTARLLERLTARRTIVLALEDLHWADRSTRELLGYLVRSLQRARLLVIATYRSDDVHRRHPLRPFLAELDRLRSVERLELDRLSRDEVRAQLAGIRGVPDPGRDLVAEIFARSEGIPFFVEELALSGDDAGRLSESLRDLLLVRVEALPESAQRVVRIAARNTAVEHALLATVSGLGDDELIEGLRAAVGANVLVPTDRSDGFDGYLFRHALLREAVIDDLLPGERTRLSRRYAEALEADPSLVRADEFATRLASYWYYAREPAKALPAVLVAIAETRERHAYAEQLKLLERAMELWDDVPDEQRRALPPMGSLESYPPCGCNPGSDRLELHFLDLLAEASLAARMDGMAEKGLSFVKKALRHIDTADDPLRAAWFWMERSRLLVALGRADGWPELGRALELLEGQPPSAVYADVLSQAAIWQWLHTSDASTPELARQAAEMARLVGAEEIELQARITLSSIRSLTGDPEEWIAEMYELRELAGRLSAPRAIMRIHSNLPDALEKIGRSAEAVREGMHGMAELGRRGLYDAAAFAAVNVAESLVSLGEWDRAEAMLDEWRSRATFSRARASVELHAAELALLRGRYGEVPPLLAAARRFIGKNISEPQYLIPIGVADLQLHAAEGRPAEALAGLRKLLAGLPYPGQEAYVVELLLAGATLVADARGLPGVDAAEHEALTARLTADAEALAVAWPAARLALAAELARARGESDAGRWAAACEAYAAFDHPYVHARLAHRRAEALLTAAGTAGGSREDAAPLLCEAYAAACRLGAEPLREDIGLLAGRARIALAGPDGAAGATPDPAGDLGLTARERDVLRLVTAGRSNRQIAGELFISPKTASVHVSNMMAKLGVASRGEAAALAHRLRLFEDLA